MKRLCIVMMMTSSFSIATVSFDAGMSCCKYYRPEKIFQRYDWSLIRQLYEQNWIVDRSDAHNIPRIIHQIWLGSSLPAHYEKHQRSWQKLHPNWQYRLWTDADVESFGLKNKKAYDAATNWGQKSDIFRYEILQRYGGLYVDCDFECLASFDHVHMACDFYAGVAYGAVVTLYNGLIAACPGHPIITRCVERISLERVNEDDFFNTLHTTGPMYFTRCFFEVIEPNASRIVIFPVSFFYPWPDYARNIPLSMVSKYIRHETMAIHYWHTSWVAS